MLSLYETNAAIYRPISWSIFTVWENCCHLPGTPEIKCLKIQTFIKYFVKNSLAKTIDPRSSCTKYTRVAVTRAQTLVGTIQPGPLKLLVLSLHGARQQRGELQGMLITNYLSIVVSLDRTRVHMTFITAEIPNRNYVNNNRGYFIYIFDCGHIVYSPIYLKLRVWELLDNHYSMKFEG